MNLPPEPPKTALSDKDTTKKTPTPTSVPLGLSLPQDFPPLAAPSAAPSAPTRSQQKGTPSGAIKPVVPVLPTPSARQNLQKEAAPAEPNKVREQLPSTAESLKEGSSAIVKSSKTTAAERKAKSKADLPSNEIKDKTSSAPTKSSDKKHRPGKLDITAAKGGLKNTEEIGDGSIEIMPPNTKGKVEVSNAVEPSQPPTPATAVSQMSVTSAVTKNQPRTVRVPEQPKAEASPSGTATPPTQVSRRPSLTSINRPGSPTSERVSDNMSLASTSISQANSPPPSKVGSAPVRHMTKNQQKKERQARAKQVEGPTKVEEPAPKVEEVQAPIVGRKKKTKKEKTRGTADSTPTVTRPTSPMPKEELIEEISVQAPATPLKEGKKGASKPVAEAKEPETPSSPATPAANEQQKASLTAASIVSSLLKAGEITGAAADLFKIPAPGLNHRFESIEPDFPEIEPPSDDQIRLLDQGEAIDIERGPNHHVVVLPDRRQVPGLTANQASRYLELRKQALSNGDVPSHQDLDGLIPTPTPVNLSALTSVTQRSSTTKRLSNKFDTPTAQLGSSNRVGGTTADETLLNKKPTISIAEAEQNLLLNRKETEALEKKLSGLLKKNRRLVFGNAH